MGGLYHAPAREGLTKVTSQAMVSQEAQKSSPNNPRVRAGEWEEACTERESGVKGGHKATDEQKAPYPPYSTVHFVMMPEHLLVVLSWDVQGRFLFHMRKKFISAPSIGFSNSVAIIEVPVRIQCASAAHNILYGCACHETKEAVQRVISNFHKE